MHAELKKRVELELNNFKHRQSFDSFKYDKPIVITPELYALYEIVDLLEQALHIQADMIKTQDEIISQIQKDVKSIKKKKGIE